MEGSEKERKYIASGVGARIPSSPFGTIYKGKNVFSNLFRQFCSSNKINWIHLNRRGGKWGK
jgi:hypothetical protein